MVKVVIDTVVFIRSLINPYSRNGKAVFERSNEYTLIVSKPVVQEIIEVIQRPELTRKYHTREGIDIEQILSIIGEASAVDIAHIPLVSRDIKDNKFLATADAAKADIIVSADKDLLDLKEYRGIAIMTVEQFLAFLDQEK